MSSSILINSSPIDAMDGAVLIILSADRLFVDVEPMGKGGLVLHVNVGGG